MQYKENKKITGGDYDKSLAVKCVNGTFVGKKADGLVIWKGIPYATQPLGELRWKKALPATADDGVYDATKPGPVPIGPVNDTEGTAEFGEDRRRPSTTLQTLPNSAPTSCSFPSTTGLASWDS